MGATDEAVEAVSEFLTAMREAGNPGARRLGVGIAGWEITTIDYHRSSGSMSRRRIGTYSVALTTAGSFVRRIRLDGAGTVDRVRHLFKRRLKAKTLKDIAGPNGVLSARSVIDRLTVLAVEHGVAT